jgi:NAD(P)-dependent dehydrogenase (short-subunit alcohol dehydrogenase family)
MPEQAQAVAGEQEKLKGEGAMKLEGKVAIITGAGQGIGQSYALRFTDEGAKVVVPDIKFENAQKVADEIKAKGGEALAVHTDVSNEASVNELVKKVLAQFGKIDILINNAAIYYGVGFRPWDSWTIDEWDRMFAVNVRGTWLCTKAVAPQMIAQGKGKIINVASGTAEFGYELLLPYSCSKAAVVSLTRSMARVLGRHNINVNCISPGFTLSEASTQMPGSQEGAAVPPRALPRPAYPEDIVGTAVFLASEDSDYITGQNVGVNGGNVMR